MWAWPGDYFHYIWTLVGLNSLGWVAYNWLGTDDEPIKVSSQL